MKPFRKHESWVAAMCDGYMPAWRFKGFPHYLIIEKFCAIKETFPVLDIDKNIYCNVNFYEPRYVWSVFGKSDDLSFFNLEAKTYLENIEKR